jgi:hypothetical protein|tara:strand:+ start:421 stop:813 length:393 start_codon:yes stop_codon:yes gene_type:complete
VGKHPHPFDQGQQLRLLALFYEVNMKLPISRDDAAGKKTFMHFSGDDTHVVTEQKVDHILDANKRQANAWKPGDMIGNTQHHHQKVADIPVSVYYEVVKRLGEPRHNPAAWKRWLNDSENRFFRSTGSTL